jgi:hypothetical protein
VRINEIPRLRSHRHRTRRIALVRDDIAAGKQTSGLLVGILRRNASHTGRKMTLCRISRALQKLPGLFVSIRQRGVNVSDGSDREHAECDENWFAGLGHLDYSCQKSEKHLHKSASA